jgi:hypothetical protein
MMSRFFKDRPAVVALNETLVLVLHQQVQSLQDHGAPF